MASTSTETASTERATRRYQSTRRAEAQHRTRRRIIDAVVALHEEVGPARTTIVEVAERAGVSRPTVYSHFPDERALLRACAGQWLEANPIPDPGAWAALERPVRLRRALAQLYAYYARHRRMLGNVLRDAPLSAPLAEAVAAWWDPWAADATAALAPGSRRRARAALQLALGFQTWQSLTRAGLDDRAAAELMAELVESA